MLAFAGPGRRATESGAQRAPAWPPVGDRHSQGHRSRASRQGDTQRSVSDSCPPLPQVLGYRLSI